LEAAEKLGKKVELNCFLHTSMLQIGASASACQSFLEHCRERDTAERGESPPVCERSNEQCPLADPALQGDDVGTWLAFDDDPAFREGFAASFLISWPGHEEDLVTPSEESRLSTLVLPELSEPTDDEISASASEGERWGRSVESARPHARASAGSPGSSIAALAALAVITSIMPQCPLQANQGLLPKKEITRLFFFSPERINLQTKGFRTNESRWSCSKDQLPLSQILISFGLRGSENKGLFPVRPSSFGPCATRLKKN
jgi:hypothetical protein